ncbi:M50 family metallopeptidase [Propionibacteriaceae bacterium G57]|uniref:M50 family metallopeptidase n=1 Tax=Aestuariimicrobium sp. G57 TaxID=3418485 RepID=UPI003DA7342D
MDEIWTRITTRQPVPEPQVVALLGGGALLLVVFAWPVVRMLVTIVHEAGHALVATLTGRSLSGIRLHSDTSGLTVTRGRPTGPGMVATLTAGYTAPGIVGLAAALVLASGHAVGLLWAWVAALAVMLLFIRNFYGLLVMVVVGGLIGAATWYLDPLSQSWLAYLLTWLLLLSAPRPAVEVIRRPSSTSDAAQLARITRVPATMWNLYFLLITLACLVVGVAVLAPQVLSAT